MVKHYCDKCGKEIMPFERNTKLARVKIECIHDYAEEILFDLCRDCGDKLWVWMREGREFHCE